MVVAHRRIGVFVAAVALQGLAREMRAQAPRGAADAEIGEAKVHVDFGVATWDEKQRAALDRIEPGGTWAFGADERTTLAISDGALRIGDVVFDEGTFGFAARRTADQGWAFWIDDGSDALIPAAKAEVDPKAAVAKKLAITFAEANGAHSLEVRYGPFLLKAPVVAVAVKETEVTLGGERASARWFSIANADAPRLGTWTRVGTTQPFTVNDLDASFDVEMKVASSGATLRFSNKVRERVVRKLADVEQRIAARSAHKDEDEDLDARKATLQDELKSLAAAPAPFEVTVTLAPVATPTAHVGAELVSRGPQLFLVVDAGDRTGQVAFDETKVLPTKDGGRR